MKSTLCNILVLLWAFSGKYCYAHTSLYQYAPNFGYATPPDVSNVQHHAQDDFGQYNYGYSNAVSAKTEIKTADGVVRGTYSYVDANNIVQTVRYISDANGFRVQATNLPHGPDAAPAIENIEETVQPATPTQFAPIYFNQYAPSYQYYTPSVVPAVAAQPIPVVANVPDTVAPVQQTPLVQVPVSSPEIISVPIHTKYHAQDEFGQYQFGYTDGSATRDEARDAFGNVRGSYTYVDINGVPQTVNYVADHNGFQVQGTTIQEDNFALPEPVQDTPEVKAAKEEHARLVAEVKAQQGYQAEPEPVESLDVLTPELDVRGYNALEQEVEETPEALEPANIIISTGPAQYYSPNVLYEAQIPQHLQPIQPTNAVPTVSANSAVVPPVAGYYAPHYGYYTSPVVVAAASSAVASNTVAVAEQPVIPSVHATQFHAQDEFGQFQYGYSNPHSTKHESKTADGIVQGTYSYVDAHGLLQTVNYVSDAEGFKVMATNLPQAPVAQQPIVPVDSEEQKLLPSAEPTEEGILDLRTGFETY